jgi:peptidoglycan/LPS O-acetylase OafA/YrhL
MDLANVFSLTPRHLWFIAYLLMISVLAIGVWLAIQRAPGLGATLNRGFRKLMKSWWAVPALASISAAILITKTGWVAGGSAANSLIPAPTLFAYYSFFFVFGWLLSGQSSLVEELKRGAWLRLAAGVLIAVPAFLLFYDNGDFTGGVGTPGVLAEIDELRLYGLFTVGMVCWLTMFGIWGVLARYVHKESRVLRYLSDASFWVYLVHIPFLVALQSSLAETDLAVPARYVLTVGGTLALAIGSYALVRGARKLALRAGRPRGVPG